MIERFLIIIFFDCAAKENRRFDFATPPVPNPVDFKRNWGLLTINDLGKLMDEEGILNEKKGIMRSLMDFLIVFQNYQVKQFSA